MRMGLTGKSASGPDWRALHGAAPANTANAHSATRKAAGDMNRGRPAATVFALLGLGLMHVLMMAKRSISVHDSVPDSGHQAPHRPSAQLEAYTRGLVKA
jgi:hypothetical protein